MGNVTLKWPQRALSWIWRGHCDVDTATRLVFLIDNLLGLVLQTVTDSITHMKTLQTDKLPLKTSYSVRKYVLSLPLLRELFHQEWVPDLLRYSCRQLGKVELKKAYVEWNMRNLAWDSFVFGSRIGYFWHWKSPSGQTFLDFHSKRKKSSARSFDNRGQRGNVLATFSLAQDSILLIKLDVLFRF